MLSSGDQNNIAHHVAVKLCNLNINKRTSFHPFQESVKLSRYFLSHEKLL